MPKQPAQRQCWLIVVLAALLIAIPYFRARPTQDLADAYVAQIHTECPTCVVAFTNTKQLMISGHISFSSGWCVDAYAITITTINQYSAYLGRRLDNTIEIWDSRQSGLLVECATATGLPISESPAP